MKKLIFLLFCAPWIGFGQTNQLELFNNLVGKTWKAEGNWNDGSKFYQELTINYELDSAIIEVNTIGFVNTDRTEIGDRNHGIRKFDLESGQVLFWEFDVFGGITFGTVMKEENSLIYEYDYGDAYVTEMWEYVNDSTYNFKIGVRRNDKWEQVFLETQFVQVK